LRMRAAVSRALYYAFQARAKSPTRGYMGVEIQVRLVEVNATPQQHAKAVDWLAPFRLWSRERMAPASKSELRRWFDAGNVLINAERMAWDERMDFPITSCVIFPSGRRVTLL
jgi:hypothetical protein